MPPEPTIAEQISAVRGASNGGAIRPHALRAALATMERAERLEAMVEAARAALADFTRNGVPEKKTDEHLDGYYWFPSGRMINTGPMMGLHDALAALDAADAGLARKGRG